MILGLLLRDGQLRTALTYGAVALGCVGGCRLLSAAFADVGLFTWALVVFELGAAGLNLWGLSQGD